MGLGREDGVREPQTRSYIVESGQKESESPKENAWCETPIELVSFARSCMLNVLLEPFSADWSTPPMSISMRRVHIKVHLYIYIFFCVHIHTIIHV